MERRSAWVALATVFAAHGVAFVLLFVPIGLVFFIGSAAIFASVFVGWPFVSLRIPTEHVSIPTAQPNTPPIEAPGLTDDQQAFRRTLGVLIEQGDTFLRSTLLNDAIAQQIVAWQAAASFLLEAATEPRRWYPDQFDKLGGKPPTGGWENPVLLRRVDDQVRYLRDRYNGLAELDIRELAALGGAL